MTQLEPGRIEFVRHPNRISAVRFRRLHSGPGFSHHAVEAEARVYPDDDPAAVLRDLKTWVAEQIGLVEAQAATSAEIARMRSEAATWREYADKNKKEYEWFAARVDAVMLLVEQARDRGVEVDEELWKRFLDTQIPF